MNTLIAIGKFLDGKKTYIATVLLAVYGVVKAFGVDLTVEQDVSMLALIGALLGVGIGNKLDKLK